MLLRLEEGEETILNMIDECNHHQKRSDSSELNYLLNCWADWLDTQPLFAVINIASRINA
jgi:hypothetical protein